MSEKDKKSQQEAGAFLAEMTSNAMDTQGGFDVGKAQRYLDAEIKKRRDHMAALNAQTEVLQAMKDAFSGWETVANPVNGFDRLGLFPKGQPVRAARGFDDDDNNDLNTA